MAIKTPVELKQDMPVGVTGGTSVSDIHNIVDSFKDRDSKINFKLDELYHRVTSLESQLASAPGPLYTMDWTSGVPVTGVTVARTGVATYIDNTGLRKTAGVNTQRIDFSASADKSPLGLMIEPGRTNIILASEDLNNGWGQNGAAIITGGQGIGMTGGNTLSMITGLNNGPFAARSATIVAGSTVTTTWWLKAGDQPYVMLTYRNLPSYSNAASVWVDLRSAYVTGVSPGGNEVFGTTARAYKLANGIVEVTMTAQTAVTTEILFELRGVGGSGLENGALIGTYFYFDSVYAEVGAEKTSYIPVPAFTPISRGTETVTTAMANGTYDILVRDRYGAEWRNAVTVSGGTYTLTPRSGQRHISKLMSFAAGALNDVQKTILAEPSVAYNYRNGYNLVWSDEFTDPDLNRFSEDGLTSGANGGKAWRARYPFGELVHARSVNNESQIYTNKTYLGIVPFSVANSVLTIKADVFPVGTANIPTNEHYEPDAPYKFYSGVITSEKTRLFTYGVFEIRSKSPTIAGTWPAFWLFRSEEQGTEVKGEIDIFEHIGGAHNDASYQAYHDHVGNPGVVSGGHFANLPDGDIGGWHVYACKWEPGKITYYIDGIVTKEFVTNRFDGQECYIIVNLALNTSLWTGSNGAAGDGDPNPAQLPTYLHVDYVRVYQLDSGNIVL